MDVAYGDPLRYAFAGLFVAVAVLALALRGRCDGFACLRGAKLDGRLRDAVDRRAGLERRPFGSSAAMPVIAVVLAVLVATTPLPLTAAFVAFYVAAALATAAPWLLARRHARPAAALSRRPVIAFRWWTPVPAIVALLGTLVFIDLVPALVGANALCVLALLETGRRIATRPAVVSVDDPVADRFIDARLRDRRSTWTFSMATASSYAVVAIGCPDRAWATPVHAAGASLVVAGFLVAMFAGIRALRAPVDAAAFDG